MTGKVVALSGGVGGAKLALGLSRVLPPGALTIIANTGDDFVHLGLAISPDIDTLVYTLGGLDNQATGWGRRDESWNFMAALEALGGETWFQLGDRDLAMHVERTRRLAAGESLGAITDDIRRRLGIASAILPMSDDPVRTRIRAEGGWLDFQDWFVRCRAEPAISAIDFAGADDAQPNDDVLAALGDPALSAVVICPSNPLISIGPILMLAGLGEALAACAAPVIAVSPIIAGKAVKGPSETMLRDLGHEPSAAGVARLYGDIVDRWIIDRADSMEATRIAAPVTLADTLMVTLDDRENLARVVLEAAQ